LERLEHHGRLTAHVTARLPVPKHLADIAIVAGMLHDVGKLILAWKLPDRFKKLLAKAAEERCPLYKVEEREFGFSHAAIGAYLLGLWGLPYILVEAVALHHRPNRVPHYSFDTVPAVYVANLLAHELEAHSTEVPLENGIEANQDELAALGVERDLPAWRTLAAEIPARLAEA
jgi:HD-like signal output (HDOD) protein